MEEINRMKIEIKAVLENVAIVRVAISSFISTLDITIDELMDIKTAISEAVTNSIEHGYDEVDDLENKSVIVKAYIYSDNDFQNLKDKIAYEEDYIIFIGYIHTRFLHRE